MDNFIPPNLARLGVKRRVNAPKPDIETIWITPYPVISRYNTMMMRLGLALFGGGTRKRQGSGRGRITSGYRTSIGARNSAHKFGIAIDIWIGDIEQQIKAAYSARMLFSRIGIYVHEGIVHVDLASNRWMKKYNGRRYWVAELKNGKRIYTNFDDFDSMIKYSRRFL